MATNERKFDQINATDFLTEQELSDLLKVSPRTLQLQRRQGRGIRFIRLEGVIRYSVRDVRRHLELCTVDTRYTTKTARRDSKDTL